VLSESTEQAQNIAATTALARTPHDVEDLFENAPCGYLLVSFIQQGADLRRPDKR
jgi:hypothetical protein